MVILLTVVLTIFGVLLIEAVFLVFIFRKPDEAVGKEKTWTQNTTASPLTEQRITFTSNANWASEYITDSEQSLEDCFIDYENIDMDDLPEYKRVIDDTETWDLQFHYEESIKSEVYELAQYIIDVANKRGYKKSIDDGFNG